MSWISHKSVKRIATSLLLLGSFLFYAGFAQAKEVTDLTVNLKVNADNLLEVEEIINYNFGEVFRHGIYRDIPINYPGKFGERVKLNLQVTKVLDQNNQPLPYQLINQGSSLRVKIGSDEQTVKGNQLYKIYYQTNNAITFFADHDELYWNVTGHDWTVPIKQASATLKLPVQLNFPDLKITCLTGVLGSTTADCQNTIQSGELKSVADNLAVGQGLTMVSGWPKGIVNQPSVWQKFYWFVSANPGLLLPFLFLIIFYLLWYLKGRDELGRGVVVAQYEPPRKLSPGEIGTIFDEKVHPRDITCTLIDLARRGYYLIREVDGKTTDWEFIKLKPGNDLLDKHQHEWEIYQGLFSNSHTSIKLSELKDFYRSIRNYKKALYTKVADKQFFFGKPNRVRALYFSVSFLLLILVYAAFGLIFKTFGLLDVASFLLSIVLAALFAQHMPRKTKLGKIVQEEIEGFKEFLSVTETERVKFHFSPISQPEKFAEYVPFAIALGVEKDWAKVFANVTLENPTWYESSRGQIFNSILFTNALTNFSATSSTAFIPASRSASGGASGFSGGVSGGGFGGGGGGSW